MSKAERRKRARQRQKLAGRVPVAAAAESDSPPSSPLPPETTSSASSEGTTQQAVAASAPAPATSVGTSSQTVVVSVESADDYITGPIVPRLPAPGVRAARIELPSELTPFQKQRPDGEEVDDDDDEGDPSAPIGDEDEDADEDESDDPDEDADVDEEEGDDDSEEGDEDEDDDDTEAEDDALFNAACAAVELGHRLTWAELVHYLCVAEIKDPRLGLLVTLLVETDASGQTVPLTGARVLEVLNGIGFEDLVAEARETVGLAAAAEAPGNVAAPVTPPKGKGPKPMRASDVRARQSALGTVVSVGVPSASPARRPTP